MSDWFLKEKINAVVKRYLKTFGPLFGQSGPLTTSWITQYWCSYVLQLPILQSQLFQCSNESNEIKKSYNGVQYSECTVQSAMKSMLYPAPFCSQRCKVYSLSGLCASTVSPALLSLASVLESALVSLPTQLQFNLSFVPKTSISCCGAMACNWQ